MLIKWYYNNQGIGTGWTKYAYLEKNVPIIVGKNGVEKIEEINLDEKEKSEFLHSIDAVKKLWEAASKIDPDLNK